MVAFFINTAFVQYSIHDFNFKVMIEQMKPLDQKQKLVFFFEVRMQYEKRD